MIKRENHSNILTKMPDCYEDCCKHEFITQDIQTTFESYQKLMQKQNVKFASTWVLDRDIWIGTEENICEKDVEVLSRGRVVMVNPGVTGIGREQRYIHYYIILGEYQETFIGVPITNMAFNKESQKYYLRNFFEVELTNPTTKKKYTEFRCKKRSVADIRNISGLDKRRIVKDELYQARKFVPQEYLDAISTKIRESIAKLC